jgi:hypothetical protein
MLPCANELDAAVGLKQLEYTVVCRHSGATSSNDQSNVHGLRERCDTLEVRPKVVHHDQRSSLGLRESFPVCLIAVTPRVQQSSIRMREKKRFKPVFIRYKLDVFLEDIICPVPRKCSRQAITVLLKDDTQFRLFIQCSPNHLLRDVVRFRKCRYSSNR